MQSKKPRILIVVVGFLSLLLLQACSSDDVDCDPEVIEDTGSTGASFLNNSLGKELESTYDCVNP